MSFTLIHRKNGKEIPIKMSIWDAFTAFQTPNHGSPNRYVAHVLCKYDTSYVLTSEIQCTCCGKIHSKRDPDANVGKKFDAKKEERNADNGNSGSWSTSPPVQFTAKDDKIILKMKAENKPWNEISKAMGDKGTKTQINERFKELKDKGLANEKTEEQKDKEEEKEKISEQKKAENKAKENEGTGGKKNKKNKGNDSQNDRADDKKPEKNGNMKAWADSFDKRKWVAVASKHYDKTGQRISPEMARKMAEEGS